MDYCMKDIKMSYYDEVRNFSSKNYSFEFGINWNVQSITNNHIGDGFIVQHFIRSVDTSINNIFPDDYFEAWRVTGGKCERDANQTCDDMFSLGTHYGYFGIAKSVGTKGTVKCNGDVFWIPKSSVLFSIVDGWTTTEVEGANGLKAAYEFPELTNNYYVFTRPTVVHSWDMSSDEAIYKSVLESILKMYPYSSDQKRMKEDIYNILPDDAYEGIRNRIFKEWDEIYMK
jgi:hypothetical protein